MTLDEGEAKKQDFGLLWSGLIPTVTAAVVPATYWFILAQLFPVGGRAPIPLIVLSLLATVAFSFAFGFALGGRASAILLALAAFVGICVGVIASANYDFEINHIDHNLYPFEIVVAAILIMPGMLCGLAMRAIKKRAAVSN
jgi:hypothetical protein